MKRRLVPILILLVLFALPLYSYAEDTTPPDATITTGPSGVIDYRDVVFEWKGSDDQATQSDLKYSFKLENHDDDWTSWSSDTNILYPDLPNGEYTFKVKSKDPAGNVGNAADWNFAVYPEEIWAEKWAQEPDQEHTKKRVNNPKDYDVHGLRVNADFKRDQGHLDNIKEETYWVPAAALGTPDDTSNDLLDLKGKPEEAKDEIDVLYEALAFVYIAIEPGIHNAEMHGEDGTRWEFPKPAKPAIRDGTVNCASAANIIHYLLEDDYEEVGYVWRHRDFDVDNPGGHLTSYVKHNGKYYFFDPVSLAEKKSKYPVEDGDGHFPTVDTCDFLIQSTPRKYVIYWTQRGYTDTAIFSINTADSNNFALGNKGEKLYYPQVFDGSLLTIWLDPNDTEELLEASYNPEPPTNQYNVEDYADYQPYKKYLDPEASQDGEPTVKYMPSDVEPTPDPDPMTWETKPHSTGAATIEMEAIPAVASEGFDVEYYFEETTGNPGADESGWQSDNTYSDSDLEVGSQYCYRVQARDTSPDQNMTAWSDEVCLNTGQAATLTSGWNLFSPPGVPQNPDPGAALGDDIDPLTLYYDYSNENYTNYPNTSTQLTWEQGYWVQLNKETQVDIAVDVPTQDHKLEFTGEGWHMIGMPYPVDWSQLSFSDPQDFQTDGAEHVRLVSWNPTQELYLNHYSDISYVLDPWRGYWIKVKEASSSDLASITISKTDQSPTAVGTRTPLPQSVDRSELDYPPLPQKLEDNFQVFAYPNPVMEENKVTFAAQIAGVEKIKVTVTNPLGKVVYDSGYESGRKLTWNLKDLSDSKVANGIYLYKIQTKGVDGTSQISEVKRLLVLR